jgi:hypothetical protein
MPKLLFTLLTDPLGLPIHVLWEYVILTVINEIAYRIAWDASPGGLGGSTIHWIVRAISFVIMWAVTYFVISVVKWIFTHWVLIVCIIGAVLLIAGIATIIILRKEKLTAGEKNA